MKAVVWSDTLQIFLMVGSMVALVIKGLMDVGVINVWERNLNSGRLEFLKYTKERNQLKSYCLLSTLHYLIIFYITQHRF